MIKENPLISTNEENPTGSSRRGDGGHSEASSREGAASTPAWSPAPRAKAGVSPVGALGRDGRGHPRPGGAAPRDTQ